MPSKQDVHLTLEEQFEHQAKISLTPDTPVSPLAHSGHSLGWDFNPKTGPDAHGTGATHTIGGDDTAINTLPESASTDVLKIISTIWKDKSLRDDLCNLKGHDAQLIIDYLYSVLLTPVLPEPWLRRHCIIALYKLCKASQLYPHCYTLKESIVLGSHQWSTGASSDIMKGSFGEKQLCLKQVRLYRSNLKSMLKIYVKEAVLWGQLCHPNIAPFYGIYHLNHNCERICLVSPWMQYGTLVDYLRDRPSAPRVLLVYDVVAGLCYLHELGLIHSDLKGANILVNDIEHACITDFGFSFIRTDRTLAQAVGTSTAHGFTQQWAAPELLDDDGCPTMESDIWALGCVCLEILTGKLPYHGMTKPQIIRALMRGQPPPRPASFTNRSYEIIWNEVDRCWAADPEERPKCQDILLTLKGAGISRGENDLAQYDAEHEIQRFRDSLRIEREDPVDLEAVRRVLENLQRRSI